MLGLGMASTIISVMSLMRSLHCLCCHYAVVTTVVII